MKVHHVVRHGVDFLLLALILGLGLFGLVYFKYDAASQVAVAILLGVLYVFWGAFHHYHDGNLTSQVILEYVSIAALADFVLVVFLLRI